MKYMGSKLRIAKEILPIIFRESCGYKNFYDMFTGGGELICEVPDDYIKVAVDINSIHALLLIKNHLNLIPKNNLSFTEQHYNFYKSQKDSFTIDINMLTYVGFALSYGGKWFGGWRRDKDGKRDYVAEAYRNAVKQSEKLKSVQLYGCSYDELYLEQHSIIYCDPPYANTTKYKNYFDHEKFWQWCRDKTNEGHKVFISEYNAPDDFVCIWEKEIVSSLTKDTGSKRAVERLFQFK